MTKKEVEARVTQEFLQYLKEHTKYPDETEDFLKQLRLFQKEYALELMNYGYTVMLIGIGKLVPKKSALKQVFTDLAPIHVIDNRTLEDSPGLAVKRHEFSHPYFRLVQISEGLVDNPIQTDVPLSEIKDDYDTGTENTANAPSNLQRECSDD